MNTQTTDRVNRLTRSPKPFIVYNFWDGTVHYCIARHAIAAEELMERILGNCCVQAYNVRDPDSMKNLRQYMGIRVTS